MSINQIKGFKKPKLVKGKRWYVEYSTFENSKWKRRREGFALNNIKCTKEKYEKFNTLVDDLNSSLVEISAKNTIKDFTVEQVSVLPIVKNLSGEIIPANLIGFLNYHISILRSREKLGTLDKYSSLRNILLDFGTSDIITFPQINRPFLESLETYLLNRKHNGVNIRGNTIHTHFRHLRSIYNKAIQNNVARQEEFPFKNPMNVNGFSFAHHRSPISVRCLSPEELEKVKSYNGEFQYSKRVFLFLYYCFGMYITDAAKLKRDNLIGQSLQYNRVKTKGLIPPIAINETIQELLDGFDDDGFFLLDILNSEKHKTAQQIKNRVGKIQKKINRGLKEMAKELGIVKPMTTRVARHTFANNMRKKGYSVYKIMFFLGHSDVKTTQTYLDSLDDGDYEDIWKDL